METKQLKEAIRDALVPHLAGIRNDIEHFAEDAAAFEVKKAELITDAIMRSIAQLSDPIGQLTDSIKALAEKPPAPVEVTNLVEIRIEGAASADLEDDDEGGTD